jgi:hypothetical protein
MILPVKGVSSVSGGTQVRQGLITCYVWGVKWLLGEQAGRD